MYLKFINKDLDLPDSWKDYFEGIGDEINIVAKELKMKITWRGTGINEKAYDKKNNVIIECSKKYFRPSEVQTLLGSPLKARKILKWKPKVSIEALAKEMVQNDLKLLSSK